MIFDVLRSHFQSEQVEYVNNILTNNVKPVLFDGRTWVIAIRAFATASVAKFYWQRRYYPPGPFPLPIFGNIFAFKKPGHVHDTIKEFRKKYGDVVTLWMGTIPNVFTFDLDIANEAFKSKMFSGRPAFQFAEAFMGEGTGVAFVDYGRTWEVLRRVFHAAALRFARSDEVTALAADVVDQAITLIKEKHGEEPFDPCEYLSLIVYNILAQSAYGERYTYDHPEFLRLRKITAEFENLQSDFFIFEFMPNLKYVLPWRYKRIRKAQEPLKAVMMEKFMAQVKTFDGNVRTFCDALLAAKQEAEADNKETVEQLTYLNLSLCLQDFFLAGTDTTRFTLKWLVLFMAYYLDVQTKIRNEIYNVIGDGILGQDNKKHLHYTQAFIAEVMRIRTVTPTGGVPHRALNDTTLGGKPIGKDAFIHFHTEAVLSSPKYWPEPEKFKPERFLNEQGQFISRSQAFVPFSIGRRVCPGEKLAMVDILCILVRLLQATKGSTLILSQENNKNDILYGDPEQTQTWDTGAYKIIIKKDN